MEEHKRKIRTGAEPPADRPAEGEENASVETVKRRVFLVMENRLLRDLLARLLRRERDLEVCGRSGPRDTTVEEVTKNGCDVVVLDFLEREWLAVGRGPSQGTREAIKTVAIGMDAESGKFLEAVRCGVSGYLLKDASAADVLAGVRAAVRGQASCPPQMCSMLFDTVAQIERNNCAKKLKGKAGLTLRQQKLMKLVAKGLTNKEIAEELHLSEFTVKNHMSRILKQLDAGNRSEAVEAVQECGYDVRL
jgi:DNA-binding NarL/FixJ family response regulator